MKARFQFFYSHKYDKIAARLHGFNEHIPTRDVLASNRAGNKPEPYLEEYIENWCNCRQPQIRAALAEAIQTKGEHYLILTTRHPATRTALAIGFLKFDLRRYSRLKKRNRFTGRAFYPGSITKSRICSFENGFPLRDRWTPGGRYGKQKADENLAREIIDHLKRKKNRIGDFLENVRLLESELMRCRPNSYREYSQRITSIRAKCLPAKSCRA
jgi:hypothetical protein